MDGIRFGLQVTQGGKGKMKGTKVDTSLLEIHQIDIEPDNGSVFRCEHCNHIINSEYELKFGYRFRMRGLQHQSWAHHSTGWFERMSWIPGGYSNDNCVYCKECTINSMNYILMVSSVYLECMELESLKEIQITEAGQIDHNGGSGLNKTLNQFHKSINGHRGKWDLNEINNNDNDHHWLQVICFTVFTIIDTLENEEQRLKHNLSHLNGESMGYVSSE